MKGHNDCGTNQMGEGTNEHIDSLNMFESMNESMNKRTIERTVE